MIYLDNAASSWPKPQGVKVAMMEALEEYGANPGRATHRLARKAEKMIFSTRAKVANLIHAASPEHIVFTQNSTEALNLAIKGLLKKGDHVISTKIEHNSSRRPLEYMKKMGVEVTYLDVDPVQGIDINSYQQAFQTNTKLIVVNHASNLTGLLLPIDLLASIAHDHNAKIVVDSSQTAGVFPIDVQQMQIDMLAFTGHKSLYGPQGTGGLYIHPQVELEPLIHGGTGGFSELEDQPPIRPDRYESGTRNTVGIVGLGAGIDFVMERGIDNIREHEWLLTKKTLENLSEIHGINLLMPINTASRAPIVAFTVDGFDSNEIGYILDQEYDIAVRAGLHCTPLAHQVYKTAETGAVRVSFGAFNSLDDVEKLVQAIREITE